MEELLNHNNFYKQNWFFIGMIKKAIFLSILFILMINFIGAIDVRMIQPQQGSTNQVTVYPETGNFCNVDWQCTQWGRCINGYKKRICVDANACQYEYNYPIIKLACTETVAKESVNSGMQWFVFLFFAAILLLILMIILLGLQR